MPLRRIKGLEGKPVVYHCMTRTVNGEHLFNDSAKRTLRRLIQRAADFSGVRIYTYAILSNHFHVLLSVPDRCEAERAISDHELIRRYRAFYPKPTQHRPARVCVLESIFAAGGLAAERLRESLLARMHDVSEFMKTVKQTFSRWFNRTNRRFGTLWADRFHSVLVEESRADSLLTIAAYIDLNPVRANLVADPKDYRFSGYGRAIAGDREARLGLAMVVNRGDSPTPSSVAGMTSAQWWAIAPEYRLLLYGKGNLSKDGSASISDESFAEVVRRRGGLSLAERLRCRFRALSDGAVFGSRDFVVEHLVRYRRRTRRRQRAGTRLFAIFGETELHTMRGFRLREI